MNYTIKEIKNIIGSDSSLINETDRIYHISIDSRNHINSSSTLFVAIKGTNNNAHTYIPELVKKGVKTFIVSESVQIENVNILKVDNSIEALQKLACHYRTQFNFPIISVTGSNGKTVVKEWLYQLLRYKYNIVRSPKSYNSQVGVPLSLFQIEEDHQLGIFEAGISKLNEMSGLQKMIKPQVGIFLNNLEAHSANFESLKQKAEEKAKLFKGGECLIYNHDDNEVREAIEKLDTKKIGFSLKDKTAEFFVNDIRIAEKSIFFKANFENQEIQIEIPFTDKASIQNAIACWALLKYFDIEDTYIQKYMMQLEPLAMRLEVIKGKNNCIIVNDGYNADIKSIEIALEFLSRQKKNKKTFIFTDILQDKSDEKLLYKKVIDLIKQFKIDNVVAIGKKVKKYSELFNQDTKFYDNTEDYIQNFDLEKYQERAVLLKGARKFHLEQIVSLLEQKKHETYLEVNLAKITQNLNSYRKKLLPKTKIMTMIKAFGYGVGSFEVAKLLEYQKVDYLAVAYVDEGMELREYGIEMPIMVVNPAPDALEKLIENNLEPEIYSIRILEEFIKTLIQKQRTDYPIHIKIETGIHRLGFDIEEISHLVNIIKSQPEVRVASIFSHLASSDNPDDDSFTIQQLNAFDKYSKEFIRHFPYSITRHILNTNGVLRFPDYQFDMVRLGIGLYGYNNDNITEGTLVFKSVISQIKNLKIGDSVSYNRNFIATKPTRIGIVPVGYADGLRRILGNGNYALKVQSQECKILGAICMDMCMIDISNFENIQEGEEVTIFSTKEELFEIAKKTNTIAYEVLTSISSRVKRVYIQE